MLGLKYLRPSIIHSVLCDRIVQRAYYKQMKEALASKSEGQTPHQIVKGICGYAKGGGGGGG